MRASHWLWFVLALAVFATASLSSCSEDGTPASKKSDQTTGPTYELIPLPEKTPDVFRVLFKTTCGDFVMQCHREWSPLGADRFFEMLKVGFWKDIGFFRVVPGFIVQFGISGDPEKSKIWLEKKLQDEPVIKSNTRGMVSFARGGPNTRTTQMFINFAANPNLDGMGFSPFAKVVEGMDIVDSIYNVGEAPQQPLIHEQGNAYLKANFPKMDYIHSATLIK